MKLKLIFLSFFALNLQAAEDLSSRGIHKVLLRSVLLPAMDRQTSCSEAYRQLCNRLNREIETKNISERFKNTEKKEKFISLVSTRVNFVGWSRYAKSALAQADDTYQKCLEMIDLAYQYTNTESVRRNFIIAKARLKRLSLEYSMTEARQTYEQADPDAVLRKEIYDLLDSLTEGAKVRFLEQADIIMGCNYSPTGYVDRDLHQADLLMQNFFEITRSSRRTDSAASSSSIPSPASSSAASSSPIPSHTSAAPYLSTSNEEADIIRSRARQISREINRRITALSTAPVVADTGPLPNSDSKDEAVGPLEASSSSSSTTSNDMNVEQKTNDDLQDTESQPLKKPKHVNVKIELEDAESDQESSKSQRSKKRKQVDVESESGESESDASTRLSYSKQAVDERRGRIQRAIDANPGATQEKIAQIAGTDITRVMVTKYLGNKSTITTPRLTPSQKDHIKELLAVDTKISHKHVAEQVGCKSSQVAKYVETYAKHLKKFSMATPALTESQKESIEELLSSNPKMSHKDVAEQVGCKSTQVSKYIDKSARHLKKYTLSNYERRPTTEIEISDQEIKTLIDTDKSISNDDICRNLDISKEQLNAFYKRHKEYLQKNRK